jgi:hypothetical protein
LPKLEREPVTKTVELMRWLHARITGEERHDEAIGDGLRKRRQ